MQTDYSKIPWPTMASGYELNTIIGHGASSLVRTAFCPAKNQHVAVKIIDFEQANSIIDELQNEIQAMHMCSHENVVSYYTSFVNDTELWIIMKLMDGGSVLDLISKAKSELGVNCESGVLSETLIIAILKEVIKALQYFHQKGQIHRDVKAGNILISIDGTVRLADFGVSAVIMDYEDRGKIRKTFVGTPCWMAPEVMEQINGYNYKADIWSLGITALEMATGEAPYARYSAMKVLVRTLNNPPPSFSSYYTGHKDPYKQYSKKFRKFIEKCLQKDPSLRPDTSELLKMKIFRSAKDRHYLAQQFKSFEVSLTVKSYHLKPQSKVSTEWQKDPSGFWIFPDSDGNLPESSPTHSEPSLTTSTSKSDNPEPRVPFPDQKKIGVYLRIRNKYGDMNDIFFRYDIEEDSPEKVVQEMVAAELVHLQDWICITANLKKLIYENKDRKFTSITFRLVNHQLRGPVDETKLIGYAQLSLEENNDNRP